MGVESRGPRSTDGSSKDLWRCHKNGEWKRTLPEPKFASSFALLRLLTSRYRSTFLPKLSDLFHLTSHREPSKLYHCVKSQTQRSIQWPLNDGSRIRDVRQRCYPLALACVSLIPSPKLDRDLRLLFEHASALTTMVLATASHSFSFAR